VHTLANVHSKRNKITLQNYLLVPQKPCLAARSGRFDREQVRQNPIRALSEPYAVAPSVCRSSLRGTTSSSLTAND
jgi:hypothetical protein